MKALIRLLALVFSVTVVAPVLAAAPMPSQQQQFCQYETDRAKSVREGIAAPSNLNPIEQARRVPPPNPNRILFSQIKKLLGTTGYVEGWSGHLDGIQVFVGPNGKKLVAGYIKFECPVFSQEFGLHFRPLNGPVPDDHTLAAHFGLIPIDSGLATELSKLANQSPVIFSGNFGYTKQSRPFGDMIGWYIGETFDPPEFDFLFNLTAIKAP